MNKKLVYLMFLVIILTGLLVASTNVHRVKAPSTTIYIRADGSIEPSTTLIFTADNITYSFTDSFNASIVVERSNIIIDGNGYTLSDFVSGNIVGFNLTSVSNVTIKNVNIVGFGYGIYLESASQIVISGNNITYNEANIWLQESFENTISGNTLTYGAEGIDLFSSSGNTLLGNDMTNNYEGVYLDSSSNNSISENNITNNSRYGIYLKSSSNNNTLSGNNITGNSYYGINLFSSSENTILSNAFYSNSLAGIYLSRSSDNTIRKNTNSSDSQYGVVLWEESQRNIVSENILSPSNWGIAMGYSDDNRILNNTVSHTEVSGIQIQYSCNNSIIANNMISENNLYGISIQSDSEETRYNVILGNNIMHNLIGIRIARLRGNIIYHNNFVNNTNQTSISNSTNIWDNGFPSGGNYWSNYTGVDLDPDGIGDTEHVINENNTDNYPLMGMFSDFKATSEHHVQTISNSTISNFQFNGTAASFNVSGEDGTVGFCRILIPTALMNTTYKVFVNGTEVSYTLPFSNSTHSYLYFTYSHSTQEVVIIPEFPLSLVILPLFMMTTLLATIVYRRKKST